MALVRPDPQLLRSANIALSAWNIDVVSVDAPPPGAPPQAARSASDIARQAHADAIAWVSQSNAGTVLWIYDVHNGDIDSRVLSDAPPFDEPTAAAAALSLKALLRSSSISPDATAPMLLLPPRPDVFWIEAEVGGRTVPGALAEPRGALSFALWPLAFDEHLGFAIGGSDGLGVAVTTEAPTQVEAHFNDLALSTSVRTRVRFGPLLGIEPSLGGSAHLTSLSGTAGSGGARVFAHRVDASLDAGLAIDLRTGTLGIAVSTSLQWLPRYPRYLVYGEEVFSVVPLMVGVSLRVSAGAF